MGLKTILKLGFDFVSFFTEKRIYPKLLSEGAYFEPFFAVSTGQAVEINYIFCLFDEKTFLLFFWIFRSLNFWTINSFKATGKLQKLANGILFI